MFTKPEDNGKVNRYIRGQIRQVRTMAGESQNVMAKKLNKSRVTISDMERGRVTVSAEDLAYILKLSEIRLVKPDSILVKNASPRT